MSELHVQRFAAFADGDVGGNPAGVAMAQEMPEPAHMQALAAEVGYSETAFVVPQGDTWRVRYFSPESEVPFCGHATIALGAALAIEHGDKVFPLQLNDASITVEGSRQGDSITAALQSPPTSSRTAQDTLVDDALGLFGYSRDDLHPQLEPALAEAGAQHLILALQDRQRLSDMRYELDAGRDFMRGEGLVTVSLICFETPRLIHSRNPFASGGVYEDPATGAAAAALAGRLRDVGWPHGGDLTIVQGEDMGMRSRLRAQFTDEPGSSIRVSGSVRLLKD